EGGGLRAGHLIGADGREGGAARRRGRGPGFVPPQYDATVVDEARGIDEAEGRRMAWTLARSEGIFAGTANGLKVSGRLPRARELGPGHTVVTVAVDTGLKYLGGDLYSNAPR